MTTDPSDAVLAALASSGDGTLFASQVRAAADLDGAPFEAALAVLERHGQIVVERHHVPDPHLAGDWRSVVLVRSGASHEQAAAAGRAHFDRWLLQVLQQHRCT